MSSAVASCARRSRSSGSSPCGGAGGTERAETRSAASMAVAARRSCSVVSSRQAEVADSRRGFEARSCSPTASRAPRSRASSAVSDSRRRARARSLSSWAASRSCMPWRSSASRRARASRSRAWMAEARRAARACRARGLSCRWISLVRSSTRTRFWSMSASLRSARSLRRRCLSTPAASSMKPRLSSGVEERIASSCPCPTMTCIWRPMPVSERSSWMSRRRAGAPLMEYSEPPPRNRVREIVTSE